MKKKVPLGRSAWPGCMTDAGSGCNYSASKSNRPVIRVAESDAGGKGGLVQRSANVGMITGEVEREG